METRLILCCSGNNDFAIESFLEPSKILLMVSLENFAGCGYPLFPKNGYVKSTSGYYQFGTRLKYSCHRGYSTKDFEPTICRASLNYSWSRDNNLPKCNKSNEHLFCLNLKYNDSRKIFQI